MVAVVITWPLLKEDEFGIYHRLERCDFNFTLCRNLYNINMWMFCPLLQIIFPSTFPSLLVWMSKRTPPFRSQTFLTRLSSWNTSIGHSHFRKGSSSLSKQRTGTLNGSLSRAELTGLITYFFWHVISW